ncbi:MAG: hypothetical protein EXS09_08505 [Gemmataceae bacterium]|nr:hypothetical protein [Gemmataceae bacterium]
MSSDGGGGENDGSEGSHWGTRERRPNRYYNCHDLSWIVLEGLAPKSRFGKPVEKMGSVIRAILCGGSAQ